MEQQLKRNIKIISILLAISVACLALLLIIKPHTSKDKNTPVDSEFLEGELGEISQPEVEVETIKDNMVGNSYWNTTQTTPLMLKGQSGLFASSMSYYAYAVPVDESGFDVLVCNQNGKPLKQIEFNSDPHFLTIYNNKLYGVYNKGGKSHRDVVFVYNILDDKYAEYDDELSDTDSRYIGSFAVADNHLYVYVSNPKRMIRINEKKVQFKLESGLSSLNQIEICNINNGIMYINTEKGEYKYNLSTKQLSLNETVENQINSFDNEIFQATRNGLVYDLSLENKVFYTGTIVTYNISSNAIYFSSGNRVYKYDGETLNEIHTSKNIITQIYVFKEGIFCLDIYQNIEKLEG